MTNKYVKFILEHSAEFMAKGADKIQELETEMSGAEGKEKKKALDEFLQDEVAKAIRAWDIPQVPNAIEDAYVDPIVINFIDSYIPIISQGLYDVILKGLKKVGSGLDAAADNLQEN